MRKGATSGDARLIGIGLDEGNGHIRVTQGKNFSVYMGSESTHERMQELCIKLNESLDRRGKTLSELSRSELGDLLRESDPAG